MTNHQNRATSLPNIVVTHESTGERFENLSGVFRRVFPIVCGSVRNGGPAKSVTYYGERYTITRAE